MISFLLCLAILIVGYFVYGKIVDNTFGPDDRETPAAVSYTHLDVYKRQILSSGLTTVIGFLALVLMQFQICLLYTSAGHAGHPQGQPPCRDCPGGQSGGTGHQRKPAGGPVRRHHPAAHRLLQMCIRDRQNGAGVAQCIPAAFAGGLVADGKDLAVVKSQQPDAVFFL